MIVWSDEYSTGIEDIDKQHKALFKFFGILEGRIKRNDAGIVNDCLKFMEAYMSEHFKFEEMCMFGSKCPESEKNIDAHKQFVIRLREFDQKVKDSDQPLEVLLEMNHFVENWLVNHIYKIDSELKKCWKANRLVGSSAEDLGNNIQKF